MTRAPVSIAMCKQAACQEFEVSQRELVGPCRDRPLARARQVAMHVARNLTAASFPEIGRAFNRDHTTVMHAVAKVQELAGADEDFARQVAAVHGRAVLYAVEALETGKEKRIELAVAAFEREILSRQTAPL